MSEGIVINGRFLTQRTTGVQRYARELVLALDQLDLRGLDVELICPPTAERMTSLRQIRQRLAGRGGGQVWEQFELPWLAAGRPLLCLCNLAPLVCGDRLVVLHDAAVHDMPHSYSRAFAAWNRTAQRTLAASRAHIVTVSRFSRERLARALHIPSERIEVVGNAADHVDRIRPDTALLERMGLAQQPFVMAIGSLHPNKNIRTLEAAMQDRRLAGVQLVVTGSRAPAVFNAGPREVAAPNVHYAGYASDEEMIGLLQHARAFVFPSRYEGFGLPPIEAMRLGCPVLASNAAAMPEVCGPDAALYFDPDHPAQLAGTLSELLSDPRECARLAAAGRRHVQDMTWARRAQAFLDLIRRRFPILAVPRPKQARPT